ncbi:hypothetical protein JOF56_008374 [Kibdelosporangium banguiense]|uniref:Secreted protein n=1 Tax=Kibdelosporangium banguiense TaxID=1365924 RepID=A0ABS4TUC0_9PSEU|nr:hypothetical protein [Kibdelosporangium banguiense]MBP2327989.1 hypothetical protein [Kibdelosporangium banguiense]
MSAVALAVGYAAGMTVTAGSASAADQPSTPLTVNGTQSFTVKLTRTADAAPQQGQAIQEIITCGGTVTNPYRNGSAIRVDVQASCDAIVDTIEVGVGIGINGVLGPDDGRTLAKVSFNSHFVTTPCPGTTKSYRGAGYARFGPVADCVINLVGSV